MANADKTASAKLVDSVALTLTARVATIVATSFILPIALWMGSRGVAAIDEIAKKLDVMKEASIEQSAEIRALRVESNAQQRILADHEARVRVLEAAGRVAQPITRP
jgi:hypothetical protein